MIRLHRSLLACTTVGFLFACNAPTTTDAPAAEPEVTTTIQEEQIPSIPPTRPSEFEGNTSHQEELRGLAFQALDAGDIDTAVTALLALRDTEEPSQLRASGVLLLSELYNMDGRTDQAINLLIDLRLTAPPIAELEFVLGRTYMESEHNGEAESAFREAIQLDPSFLRSYLALGSLLSSVGRTEDASEVFVLYERQVNDMAELLESDAPVDEKLITIDALGLSLPDDRLSRALGGALSDDSLAIQAAAVAALSEVGTNTAIPALIALQERSTMEQLTTRIEQAIAMIEARDVGR